MSDWGNSDPLADPGNDPNDLNGPAPLRAAYKAQKEKTDQLEQQLAAMRAELNQRAVADTLTSLGIPASAAPLYNGEANPEKVTEWANTMKSVFGGGTPAANTPTSAPPAPTLDPATQAQLQAMNEAGQSGTPLGNIEAAYASIGDANDIQGLIAAFNQMSNQIPR